MKGRRRVPCRILLWCLVLLLALPPGGILAQGQVPGDPPIFTQEELDQMLAPIALYPDELLVQVLMASTYPLEVVQAARWVQANPNLKGDQLAYRLEEQDWDPSVKSLVNFPSVLAMMNERLEWMQMLGDAFLGQETEVMDTVQQLRQRALARGSLRTTYQQRVIVGPEIVIEPATPAVVYVPVYDPLIVYGTWWWPFHRPYYYHPHGVVIGGDGFGFGVGVALGMAWGYAWGGFNWHQHDVVINVTRNVHVNTHIDRSRYVRHVTAGGGGQGTWRHDPIHRQGVAYRATSVARRYGQGPRPGLDSRRDFRGFADGGRTGTVQRPDNRAGQQQHRPASPPPQKVEPPRQVSGQQHSGPVSRVRAEPQRQPAPPAQQPRMASAPAARPEHAAQAPNRPAALPAQKNIEQPLRQASGQQAAPAVQQPKVDPRRQVAVVQPHQAPSQSRVEPGRPAAAAVPQQASRAAVGGNTRESVRPTPAAPASSQGGRGSTAFSSMGPGSQAREHSSRGRESLGSNPSGGQGRGENASSGGNANSAPGARQGGGDRDNRQRNR